MTRSVSGWRPVSVALGMVLLLAAGCGGPGGPELVGEFPMDDVEGLLDAGPDVTIDAGQSVDGGGSLHIFASQGDKLVNLHEFDVAAFAGDAVAVSARMKSEMLGGDTSFDLWIFTNEGAPRFVRRICENIGRTRDWQPVELRVPLAEGEVPVRFRTAVHMEGRGHLWIDDLTVRAVSGDGDGD